jgi:Periplasmic binding protein
MARLRAYTALDLSGPLRLQSEDARRGLELWSDDDGIDLEVADIGQVSAYRIRSETGHLILGPYGSGLVRRALSAVDGASLFWNHGGSADDLARPWAPMAAAPASGYLPLLIDLAVERGCERLTVVKGGGRFAATVVHGAIRHASASSLPVDVVVFDAWDPTHVVPGGALMSVGTFKQDVAVVASLPAVSGLVGCVAAGIPAFGSAAGDKAEGVFGPVQWWPRSDRPEVGPAGTAFESRYRARYRSSPSYVAAQAAAAGYLSAAAARRGVTADDLPTWATTTLLGDFRVDGEGRQIGHRVSVVRWRDGRMEPVEA